MLVGWAEKEKSAKNDAKMPSRMSPLEAVNSEVMCAQHISSNIAKSKGKMNDSEHEIRKKSSKASSGRKSSDDDKRAAHTMGDFKRNRQKKSNVKTGSVSNVDSGDDRSESDSDFSSGNHELANRRSTSRKSKSIANFRRKTGGSDKRSSNVKATQKNDFASVTHRSKTCKAQSDGGSDGETSRGGEQKVTKRRHKCASNSNRRETKSERTSRSRNCDKRRLQEENNDSSDGGSSNQSDNEDERKKCHHEFTRYGRSSLRCESLSVALNSHVCRVASD